MAGRIQQELRQTKPVRQVEEEAALNLIRTTDLMMLSLTGLLKAYELSPTQYNVLRIMRGAGEAGATCKDIGARLVARDPDVTRLVDRLEKRGLITRDRAKEDRRFVTTRLTKTGLELVNQLDLPMEQLHQKLMGHVSVKRLKELVDLLEELRSGW